MLTEGVPVNTLLHYDRCLKEVIGNTQVYCNRLPSNTSESLHTIPEPTTLLPPHYFHRLTKLNQPLYKVSSFLINILVHYGFNVPIIMTLENIADR